jgi:hypothetical protein
MDLTKKLTALLVLGLVFYVIERVMGARRRPGYFRPGMLADAAYFFTLELFKQASRVLLIGPFILLIIGGVTTGETIKTGQYQGFGPVAAQPRWLQAVEIYLLVDFMDYWLHRLFHTGVWWPFHAVHHSSEDLDWLSAVRVHPVNEAVNKLAPAVPLLLLGFRTAAFGDRHAGLPSLAPLEGSGGNRQEFRRPASVVGHPLRHLLHAAGPAAAGLRHYPAGAEGVFRTALASLRRVVQAQGAAGAVLGRLASPFALPIPVVKLTGLADVSSGPPRKLACRPRPVERRARRGVERLALAAP